MLTKKRYNQCAVQRAGRPSCDKMKLGKIQVAQNCQKNEAGKTRTSWWFFIKWCIIISFITMSCECISKEDRVVWGITVTVAGNSTFSLFTTNRVISPLLPRPCKTPIAKCFFFQSKVGRPYCKWNWCDKFNLIKTLVWIVWSPTPDIYHLFHVKPFSSLKRRNFQAKCTMTLFHNFCDKVLRRNFSRQATLVTNIKYVPCLNGDKRI